MKQLDIHDAEECARRCLEVEGCVGFTLYFAGLCSEMGPFNFIFFKICFLFWNNFFEWLQDPNYEHWIRLHAEIFDIGWHRWAELSRIWNSLRWHDSQRQDAKWRKNLYQWLVFFGSTGFTVRSYFAVKSQPTHSKISDNGDSSEGSSQGIPFKRSKFLFYLKYAISFKY